MQQCYRSKLHKYPFYCPDAARSGSYGGHDLVSMLGVAGQQVESVRQKGPGWPAVRSRRPQGCPEG